MYTIHHDHNLILQELKRKTSTKRRFCIHICDLVLFPDISLYESMFQGKVVHHFTDDNVRWKLNVDVDFTRH